MALEADLPEVLVRSVANPRSLLTLVLGGAFIFGDLESLDSKTLATLAFLDAFGAKSEKS